MNKTIKPGIMSAFLTPFNDDGSVREKAISELVDFQIERGIGGFYVNGSTGEGMVMSEEERMQVAEAVVKATAGRTQVIIHVGTTSTDSAIRMAKHAEKIGADGISAIPPFYYNHHMSFITDYFRDIAAATELPFLIYHSSVNTTLSYGDIMSLYEVPNIVGIKYTMDNLELLQKFKDNRPDKLVFMGHDAMMIPAITLKADGDIGAFPNVMPAGFRRAWDNFNSGNFGDALEEQKQMNHYIAIMKKYMLSAVQAPIKAVMHEYGVDCGLMLRRPAKPLDEEKASQLIKELRNEGYFDIYK